MSDVNQIFVADGHDSTEHSAKMKGKTPLARITLSVA